MPGVSPALVIYYFGTKDSLLTEAMRFSEDAFYDLGARRMEAIASAKGRLEEIVVLTCLPTDEDDAADSWTLWLDLWAQAARHPAVARVRGGIRRALARDAAHHRSQRSGRRGVPARIDADDFAVGFSALLDGLAIQIALQDPGRGRPAGVRVEHEGCGRAARFRVVAL